MSNNAKVVKLNVSGKEFGRWFQAQRDLLGWTIMDVAKRFQLNPSQITRLEEEGRYPKKVFPSDSEFEEFALTPEEMQFYMFNHVERLYRDKFQNAV